MAIDFIIEDGTGKIDSTSYASIAQFLQYWENIGTDYSAESEDSIKGWLNAASMYIDDTYEYKGVVSKETQALQWPRYGVIDRNGYEIKSDYIPKEIVDATCYMAAQAKQGSLQVTTTGIKSERYGSVSVTYTGRAGAKTYLEADKILKWLIKSGVTSQRVN